MINTTRSLWVCILACAALLCSSPSQSAWRKVYDWRIKKAARHYIPYEPWLLYKAQLIQESSLNPDAQSTVGARGIAQFMPQTWDETAKALGFHGEPTDVRLAIPAGAYYMAKLRYVWRWPRPEIDRYNLALACYNVGCGWILKAQKACGNPSWYQPIMACLPDVMKDPTETLNYAPKSVRFMRIYPVSKLAIWACLGLALFVGFQQWRIGGLHSDLTSAHKDIQTLTTNHNELAESLSSSEADNHALKQEIKRREQILLQRNNELALQRTQLAELSDKLEGLRKTNDKVKSWSIARVPDAVIRLLGSSRSKDNSQNSAR